MENQEIKLLLENFFTDAEITVEGDGYHYQIVIVSDSFSELNRVKRTQKVYQALAEHIQSGDLHALSIQTYTVQEWSQKLNG